MVLETIKCLDDDPILKAQKGLNSIALIDASMVPNGYYYFQVRCYPQQGYSIHYTERFSIERNV